jgi:hypothetical protein
MVICSPWLDGPLTISSPTFDLVATISPRGERVVEEAVKVANRHERFVYKVSKRHFH